MRVFWRIPGLLVAGLLLAANSAYAQSKATLPWAMWLGGQFNYLTSNNHAILLRTRLERSFDGDYNALDRSTGGGSLQRIVALGGYEWRLGERWSGGVLEKVTFDPGPTRTFQTGGFLRHCGHIGSVQFRKRVLAEHVATSASGADVPGAGRIRLRVDFDRTWQAGRVGLRPRIAYEFQFNVSLQQQDDAQKASQRTVDVGVLRAELAVDVTDRLSIVPFLARETRFIIAVAQSDANGVVQVPAGNRNIRSPAVGLDFRFTLPSGQPHSPPASRDLPTFEGYQD